MKPKIHEILFSKYNRCGWIYDFFDVVHDTGYPFFEWNNRIYKVSEDGDSVEWIPFVWNEKLEQVEERE